MAQSLLYYPTINIEDGEWLRSAALYWDEVCSIVPYEGFDEFSPEIQYMKERGQYRPIYPQDMLHSIYATEFVEEIKKRMRFPKRFITNKNFQNKTIHIERDKTYVPELYTLVHYKKFPNELVEQLVDIGDIRADEEGWIEMDSAFANAYMKTLAEFVALYDTENVVISSDKIGKINEIYRPLGRSQRNHALSIILANSLPAPSMEVPFEDLLDFKQNRRDDLYELQCKISEFEIQIAHCESQAEVKSVLHQFRAGWQRELKNAENMFRGDHIQFALESMGIFVGAAGSSAGLLQWTEETSRFVGSSSLVGAAVGMSGLVAVGVHNRNYRNKIKEKQKESGFAYLIGAKNTRLIRNIEMI